MCVPRCTDFCDFCDAAAAAALLLAVLACSLASLFAYLLGLVFACLGFMLAVCVRLCVGGHVFVCLID